MTKSEFDASSILFYDGTCGFCHKVIQLSNKYLAKDAAVFFSPLQGATAYEVRMNQSNFPENYDAIVFLDKGNVYIGPKAFYKLAFYFNRTWSFLRYFNYLPDFLSNFAYKIIAENRYCLFGVKESCEIPNTSFKSRFLL
jgi:predicted DCC family thiol-disulfide oxidoreductase YuxK